MKGRKPKPTALRLIEGNPGHRPINEGEPKFTLGTPTCPDWLVGAARKEWYRLVHQLADTGVLAKIERGPLATLCFLYAQISESAKEGKLPTAAIIGQYRSLCAEFGLTPTSRTRVTVVPENRKSRRERLLENPWEALVQS